MKRKAIVFEAPRTAYAINQLRSFVTVGDLRGMLEDYNEDDIIVISHDSGYTYGTLCEDVSIREYDEDEGDFEETDTNYIGHERISDFTEEIDGDYYDDEEGDEL